MPAIPKKDVLTGAELTESLREYYKSVFPAQQIINWLNYKDGDPNVLTNREFSMTLPPDLYRRYLSYKDHLELKNELVNRTPIKIDIGAIYNANPTAHRRLPVHAFKAIQHELVFDIDISDYNDVRTCCEDSNICQKCWPFMVIGAKVLHKILTIEFGFKHLLFVFSGRRGIHCWVCDQEARLLTVEARRAIVDYLTLIKGGENQVRRVELDHRAYPLHPMIVKSLDVIDEHFEDLMVQKQDFLRDEHRVQNVIDLLPHFDKSGDKNADQNFQNSLYHVKSRRGSSVETWDYIKRVAGQYKRNKTRLYLEEVKLHHCYPRLDAEVTRGINHLLKSPFAIHPKTGNVCVPLDIDKIDKFQLNSVPNLRDISDILAFKESMEPYLNIMKRFCDELMKSATRTNPMEF